MKSSFEKIYAHVAMTLPQDITERRELLQALHTVIIDGHPIKPVVAAHIAAIESMNALQLELIALLK